MTGITQLTYDEQIRQDDKTEALYMELVQKIIKADKCKQVDDIVHTLEALELDYTTDEFPCNGKHPYTCSCMDFKINADLIQAIGIICPEVLK